MFLKFATSLNEFSLRFVREEEVVGARTKEGVGEGEDEEEEEEEKENTKGIHLDRSARHVCWHLG